MACAHLASWGPRAIAPGQMLWTPCYQPSPWGHSHRHPEPHPTAPAPSPPGEAETEAAGPPKVPEPRAGRSTYARQGQRHSLSAARQQDPETSGRFLGLALSLVPQGPAVGCRPHSPPGPISGAEAGGAGAQLQDHGIGKAGAWGHTALHWGPLHPRRLTRCHLELSPSRALQVEPPHPGLSPDPLSSLGRWGGPLQGWLKPPPTLLRPERRVWGRTWSATPRMWRPPHQTPQVSPGPQGAYNTRFGHTWRARARQGHTCEPELIQHCPDLGDLPHPSTTSPLCPSGQSL
ncbi:uncharacterized protein [Symphalangus syndactylus]|uniref:uncharacterized protein n=1 Tax=Symphalangus syndactylus TaxID=9590 RepID=UPI003003C70D